jgi:hypothetical protein
MNWECFAARDEDNPLIELLDAEFLFPAFLLVPLLLPGFGKMTSMVNLKVSSTNLGMN